LTDVRNTQQAEFEAEGLQQVCGSQAEKSMLELLGHIFSTAQKFMGDCPQSNAMTAAILHYSGRRLRECVSRQQIAGRAGRWPRDGPRFPVYNDLCPPAI
jgi:hypothetical protein